MLLGVNLFLLVLVAGREARSAQYLESARDEAHYNAHAAAWHPLCIDWLKGSG